MRKIFIILFGALLGCPAGCRDGDAIERNREGTDFTKPIEIGTPKPKTEKVEPVNDDHEFVQVRLDYEAKARGRLAKLDAQIEELESRATAAAKDSATMLRARRDQLASRVDTARVQAKSSWDRFTSDLTKTLDELERDVDQAIR